MRPKLPKTRMPLAAYESKYSSWLQSRAILGTVNENFLIQGFESLLVNLYGYSLDKEGADRFNILQVFSKSNVQFF